jgi:two-component system, sensor histidine kinase and response regulator
VTPTIILNVDDHEPGRYARSRLLKQAGYAVHEAGTGFEALQKVTVLNPALVLLDVNLPDLNGFEVCRRIKTDPATARISVLQLSASATATADRVGGLDAGADTYLIEPIDPDVLLATIRGLLRARKAEDELHRAYSALQEAHSKLEEANASLLRSNEDLERFAHLVSHDLQEPLRTVSSFASLLRRRHQGQLAGDADQFLNYIEQGAARMTSLIRKLLIYAQAGRLNEAGRMRVNLEETLAEALNDLAKSIAESGARITHDPLPAVTGDPTQLAQLLQNLLSNGLKYRREGEPPRIHVSAETQPDKCVLVSISDNGVGVPVEYRKQIFAPFQRLHGNEIPGSGIGLATCQRIVEAHGGRIWVESEGPGQGATFRFLLPAG